MNVQTINNQQASVQYSLLDTTDVHEVGVRYANKERQVLNFFVRYIENLPQGAYPDAQSLHDHLMDVFVAHLEKQNQKDEDIPSALAGSETPCESIQAADESPRLLSWLLSWSDWQKQHIESKSVMEKTFLVQKYQTKNVWKLFVQERLESLLNTHRPQGLEHVQVLMANPAGIDQKNVWWKQQKQKIANHWCRFSGAAWMLLLPEGTYKEQKRAHFSLLVEKNIIALEQQRINVSKKDESPGALVLTHTLETTKSAYLTLPRSPLNSVVLHIIADMVLGQCMQRVKSGQGIWDDTHKAPDILNTALDAVLMHELGHVMYRTTLRSNRVRLITGQQHLFEDDVQKPLDPATNAYCLMQQALGRQLLSKDSKKVNGSVQTLKSSFERLVLQAQLKLKTISTAIPQTLGASIGMQAVGVYNHWMGSIGAGLVLGGLWAYHAHQLRKNLLHHFGTTAIENQLEECVADGISIGMLGRSEEPKERQKLIGLFEGLRQKTKSSDIHNTKEALHLWSMVCSDPTLEKKWSSLDNDQCVHWAILIGQCAIVLEVAKEYQQNPQRLKKVEPEETFWKDLAHQFPQVHQYVRTQLQTLKANGLGNPEQNATMQHCGGQHNTEADTVQEVDGIVKSRLRALN